MVYFGKRFLVPSLGRWLNVDPLALHSPGSADANLYAYVSGRVFVDTDPMGLSPGDDARREANSWVPSLGDVARTLAKAAAEKVAKAIQEQAKKVETIVEKAKERLERASQRGPDLETGVIIGAQLAMVPGASVAAQPLVSKASPEFQAGVGLGETGVGFTEALAGGGTDAAGGAACTSIAGCVVGAPAIVGGTTVAVVGVGNVGLGLYNFSVGRDRMQGGTLSQDPGGGGGAKPKSDSTPDYKWGNSKSRPTYGHTFEEHCAKKTPGQMTDRARAQGMQNGQWTNDQAAADFVGEVAKRGPGVHDVPLPQGVGGRTFMPNGTELVPDSARVVVNPNGSVKTSFPYSSQAPN